MSKFEEKMKSLLSERETIINEIAEIRNAFDIRQQRMIEIAGSIKTLQELMQDENELEGNSEDNTTKK